MDDAQTPEQRQAWDAAHEKLTTLSAEAADAVDEQITRLGAAADGGDAYKATLGVTKEAAILAARVARQTTADQNIATRAALDRMEDLEHTLAGVAKQVSASIDAFTAATDASTQRLATWTKWMAWATIALAVFAVAQIVVGVLALIRTP